MAGSSVQATLVMYRRILRAAAQYPSIKRSSILCGIRTEFREGSRATCAKEIGRRRAVAATSLEKLESYARIEKEKHEWALGLGTSF